MSHYRGGREFEYRTIRHLTTNGYEIVRSAGSKGKIDIVAFKLGELLFVQCKRTSGTIPPAERAELVRLAGLVNAVPLVAHQPIPRKPIRYRALTGTGPKQWREWTPDHGLQLEGGTQRCR